MKLSCLPVTSLSMQHSLWLREEGIVMSAAKHFSKRLILKSSSWRLEPIIEEDCHILKRLNAFRQPGPWCTAQISRAVFGSAQMDSSSGSKQIGRTEVRFTR